MPHRPWCTDLWALFFAHVSQPAHPLTPSQYFGLGNMYYPLVRRSVGILAVNTLVSLFGLRVRAVAHLRIFSTRYAAVLVLDRISLCSTVALFLCSTVALSRASFMLRVLLVLCGERAQPPNGN